MSEDGVESCLTVTISSCCSPRKEV